MTGPAAPSRRLGWLPGRYAVTLAPDGAVPDGDWLALVRGPEGLTVVRPAAPDDERWAALFEAAPHGLDVPGMLAAVVGPIAAAGVPVFVTSTHDADLVLVPADRRDDAAEALRRSGIAVEAVGAGD
jgi:hypothetical protein